MNVQELLVSKENKHLNVALLNSRAGFPLLIDTEQPELSRIEQEAMFLELWNQNRQWLDCKLLEHGAILFRGFAFSSREKFQAMLAQLNQELAPYLDGDSPRTKLGGGVYTSTEYPPDLSIPLHNELSYSATWPARLFFCCVLAAEQGGETPLISSRVLLNALPIELVNEFRSRKVRYVRNLHAGKGTGKSWQATFETESRAEVDRYTKAAGIEARWDADGCLRLIAVRSATAYHPITGDEVWFNQADQFHPSSLPAETFESMSTLYEGFEDEMPENATFGDGAPIPLELLQCIRSTTRKLQVTFKWEVGDLLMVDNMLLAHGRMPFKGARKVLVAMTAR